MKTPNWQEARDFVDRIAGSADPQMTFQAFDDKGERYELAAWKHGRLTDPAVRSWLQHKQNEGCGVFVTVNETNGKGRRRKNIVRARAAFVDFDGLEPPAASKCPIPPDIINETSPGKYHYFWLLNPLKDLNEWSDTQARLAAYFGADPRVFDPPRVVRLPGFYHQKGDAFRSRTKKTVSLDDARFERRELAGIIKKHPVDYVPPAARADGGRSDEPANGWDSPADVDRARAYLASVIPPKTGDRNNQGYRVAAVLNDLGISPELSVELMEEIWNERLDNPLKTHEIQHVVRSAGRYKAGSAGAKSVATEAATDFEDLEITDEFDFEGSDDTPEPEQAVDNTAEFDFEAPATPEKPPIRPAKTEKRMTGGLSWNFGHEIRPEPLTWLWPNRFPRGKVSLIAGYPDQGKSQIMLKIAALISTGGRWPNDEGFAPLGVAIILSSEDDEADTLIPRLHAAGANIENIVIVRSMVRYVEDGKKLRRVLNLDDDIAQIDQIIKQIHNDGTGRRVRMIGLDPINAYFGGAKKADSHKNSDMRALLTPIAEWAARLRMAIIAISHFNKGSNSHALYRITDSSAITAAARSVYIAVRKPPKREGDNEVERLFVTIKRNLAPDSVKGISYEIDSRDVSNLTGIPSQEMPFIKFGALDDTAPEAALGMISGERKKEAMNGAAAWLYERLEAGPVPANTIKAECGSEGHSWATVQRAKLDMEIVSYRDDKFQGKFWWRLPTAADNFDDPEESDPDFG